MEAKDAVMSRAIGNVIKRWEDPPQESTDSQYWEFEREIYEEIAEISFKAGEKQERERIFGGMVKFEEDESPSFAGNYYALPEEDWQALKGGK